MRRRAWRHWIGALLMTSVWFHGCGEDGCSGAGCNGAGGTGGGAAGAGGSAGTGGSTGGTGGGSGAVGCNGDTGAGGRETGGPIELEVDDVYILGLERPWDIGWLPNGTVIISERPGRLRVYDQGTDEEPTVIAIEDVVSTGREGGLLGLEVDPRFGDNGYVYVCLASNLGSGGNDVRVARLTMSQPNATSIEDRLDIVTGLPHNDVSGGRHSGCRPRFGPDDVLWVGTGDAAFATPPQDDDSLGGKVLRVNRDGSPASGNPGGRTWYSKGHRNIQGMAFRSDGVGMAAEHGPTIDDEVNKLVPGNFGWDPVNPSGGSGYFEGVPMTDLEKFPDAVEAVWSTGNPTLALAGATFIEGAEWGDWDGVLAVATLKAQHLHVFDVEGDCSTTSRGRFIDDQGRLRTPRQGPDGALYITTDNRGDGDRVLRVIPVPVE